MAQAVHGTAPDIAGKGVANPAALILSTPQLLDWLYQRTREPDCRATAQLLQHGVAGAIDGGIYTVDLGGSASTSTCQGGDCGNAQHRYSDGAPGR